MNVVDIIQVIGIGFIISLFLFIDVEWHKPIKKLLKVKGFKKPYDCFRCNCFWITFIVSLFYIETPKELFEILLINYGASYVLTK